MEEEKTTQHKLFKVEIVTPQRLVASEEAEMVVAPGEEGSFGAMYNHIPYLCFLKTGEVKLIKGKEEKVYALSQGFFEMSENKAIILADGAERAEEIDIERAKAAKERAIKRLELEDADYSIDIDRAKAALVRAVNRLKVAAKAGKT